MYNWLRGHCCCFPPLPPPPRPCRWWLMFIQPKDPLHYLYNWLRGHRLQIFPWAICARINIYLNLMIISPIFSTTNVYYIVSYLYCASLKNTLINDKFNSRVFYKCRVTTVLQKKISWHRYIAPRQWAAGQLCAVSYIMFCILSVYFQLSCEEIGSIIQWFQGKHGSYFVLPVYSAKKGIVLVGAE